MTQQYEFVSEPDVCPIRPLGSKIFFQFEEEVTTDGGFRTMTDTGFLIRSFDSNVKTARWGLVCRVGPDVKEPIERGDRILIDALRWSDRFKFDGKNFWMTEENEILVLEKKAV